MWEKKIQNFLLFAIEMTVLSVLEETKACHDPPGVKFWSMG